MTKKIATLVLMGGLVLTGLPALAQQGQARSQDQAVTAAALKERFAEMVRQRESVATKLSAADYQRLSQQEREFDALIKRLEAGQSVTPAEVDRALGVAH